MDKRVIALALLSLLSPAYAENFHGTTVPSNTFYPDPDPVELALRFSSAVSGNITAIRWYKDAAHTGVVTGRVYDNNQALIYEGVFPDGVGWVEHILPAPIPINSGEEYVVSIHTTSGYISSGGYFTSPITVGNLTASTPNNIFLYGAGGSYPTDTWNASNYWVDVEFEAGDPPPPPPPQCDDAIDNDGDGLIDLLDPGCEDIFDDDEFNQEPPPVRYPQNLNWTPPTLREDGTVLTQEEIMQYDVICEQQGVQDRQSILNDPAVGTSEGTIYLPVGTYTCVMQTVDINNLNSVDSDPSNQFTVSGNAPPKSFTITVTAG